MAIIRKQKKWSDGIGYFYVAYDPEKKISKSRDYFRYKCYI
jgi:hypothetical protein